MRKALAVLLYVTVGFGLLLGSLAMMAVGGPLADRQWYKSIVTDDRVIMHLTSEKFAEAFPEKIEFDSLRFDGKAFYSGAKAVLPPELIKETLSRSVDAAFDALASPTGMRSFNLDMTGLKSRLLGNDAAFAQAYVAALKPGSVDGPGDLSAIPKGGTASSMLGAVRAGYREVVEKEIENVIGEKRVPFNPALEVGAMVGNTAMTTIVLGALAWFLLGFLAEREWGRRLRWWGVTLIVPSAIILAAGIGLAQLRSPASIEFFSLGALPQAGPASALAPFAGDILGSLMTRVWIVGAVGVGIGALLASLKRVVAQEEI